MRAPLIKFYNGHLKKVINRSTYKDFTYNYFTYDSDKCDITQTFYTSKVIYK